jgi:two-component system cell cycle sensor histidine kinase/response regulator CckA
MLLSQSGVVKSARVLVVDDEPGIREFVDRTLRAAGHVTRTAAGGPEALAIADSADPFDLLLTDLRMPEMTGDELARRIRQRQPDIKVLYLTGFSDQLFKEKGALWAGEAFLDKPSSVVGLLQAVSLLLYGDFSLSDFVSR